MRGIVFLIIAGIVTIPFWLWPVFERVPHNSQTAVTPPDSIARLEEGQANNTEAADVAVSLAPEVEGISDQSVLVTRVVDGDTIELETGRRVRYIGVDTPESLHPNKAVECFAKESFAKNKALVEGRRVRLEKDVSEADRYGRLLRYVYIDTLFVNDVLVREGFAHASSYPPDVKYQDKLREAEQSARHNQWGLWVECSTQDAAQGTIAPVLIPESPGACTIKGNITADGENIYHLPGCKSYNQTKIDPGRGEQYFCSEDEAKAAGWRKALNCL